jgi:hypothetical protein
MSSFTTINSTINNRCPCCIHIEERWGTTNGRPTMCMNCYNGIKMEKRCIRCGIPGCPAYNSKYEHPDVVLKKIREVEEIEKIREIEKNGGWL